MKIAKETHKVAKHQPTNQYLTKTLIFVVDFNV